MTYKHGIYVVILGLFANINCPVYGEPPRSDDRQVVAIQSVITEIRDALIRVQKTLRNEKYPPLKAVTLTLQTTAARQVGGKIKLFVITLGKKLDKQYSQELAIQLTPPHPNSPSNVGVNEITASLETAIVSAVEGAKSAGNRELPLQFTGLEVNIAFSVKNDSAGGATFQLIPISADLSAEISNGAVQRLRITFGDLE